MYFAQRPIFEHSVSGDGNLPSHRYLYGVTIRDCSSARLKRCGFL